MLSDIHWYAGGADILKRTGAVSGAVGLNWNDRTIVWLIAVFLFINYVLFFFCMLWKANNAHQQSHEGPEICKIVCDCCCFPPHHSWLTTSRRLNHDFSCPLTCFSTVWKYWILLVRFRPWMYFGRIAVECMDRDYQHYTLLVYECISTLAPHIATCAPTVWKLVWMGDDSTLERALMAVKGRKALYKCTVYRFILKART